MKQLTIYSVVLALVMLVVPVTADGEVLFKQAVQLQNGSGEPAVTSWNPQKLSHDGNYVSGFTGSNYDRGYYWDTSDGTAHRRGYAPSPSNYGVRTYDVNNNAIVAGRSMDSSYKWHATYWTSGSANPNQLNGLGGTNSEAKGINDSGKIAGFANDGSNDQPCTWNVGSTALTQLSLNRTGDDAGMIYGINSSGVVSGSSTDNEITGSGKELAVYWDASNNCHEIGRMSYGIWARGMDVNDSGLVVCFGDYSASHVEAMFVYDISTGTRIVDNLNMGGSKMRPIQINNSGVVVGYATDSGGTYYGVIWDATNGLRKISDLIDPALGLDALYAFGISDDGKVSIRGRDGLGYVLVVPEPATLCLLGLGGIAVLVRRKRRS